MPQGEIIAWDEHAGRGHIARDQAAGELILMQSQCMGLAVRKGMRVSFNIAAAPRTGRPMATNVRPAAERKPAARTLADRFGPELD
jgi:hypothetical protein